MSDIDPEGMDSEYEGEAELDATEETTDADRRRGQPAQHAGTEILTTRQTSTDLVTPSPRRTARRGRGRARIWSRDRRRDRRHINQRTIDGNPIALDPLAARRSSSVSVAPRSWLARVGPGVITGASDDDPSGIATYSQVGSQFGFGLLWTMTLCNR